jgi:MFS transporter, CP family, cyanate transporter
VSICGRKTTGEGVTRSPGGGPPVPARTGVRRGVVRPLTGRRLSLLGLLLVALNLRAAIAALGPLLPDVRLALGLDRATAGLLTTLPVLCFGLLSGPGASLGRRVGIELGLLLAMLGIAGGSLLRTLPGAAWMLGGTGVIGAAITLGNVLVPAMVKRDFDDRSGLVTGLYTAALTGGAAISSAVSAPLSHAARLGWRGSLLVWGGVAALTACLCVPRLRLGRGAAAPRTTRVGVLGSAVTWQLSIFMAMQALTYYAVLAWLPALLQDRGVSAAASGWALALYNLLGIVTAVVTPTVAARRADQRRIASLVCAGWALAIAGLLLLPAPYLLWTVVAGLAQGAGISLAMALLVLRARTPESARELSGAVQSVGYLLGSSGPLVIGELRDSSGSWQLPLCALLVSVAVMAVAGREAGRDRLV